MNANSGVPDHFDLILQAEGAWSSATAGPTTA
jgi:hypothetical protein